MHMVGWITLELVNFVFNSIRFRAENYKICKFCISLALYYFFCHLISICFGIFYVTQVAVLFRFTPHASFLTCWLITVTPAYFQKDLCKKHNSVHYRIYLIKHPLQFLDLESGRLFEVGTY